MKTGLKFSLMTLLVAAWLPIGSTVSGQKGKGPKGDPTFTKLWTHGHSTPGQVSEIPAFDEKTNTIWVAGVVGVDVLDADTGGLIQHIDVTSWGRVNSVAIHKGLAALAIEANPDRRDPGVVVFFDTKTRMPTGGISEVEIGALPDMATFTHDGRKVLVANEGTPNAVADTPYTAPDPPGSVSIIDVKSRTVLATAGLSGVPPFNNPRTGVGMDFEPEYIAVDHNNKRAYVTIQEANAVGVLDLEINAFTAIIGLGDKDFNTPGNEIDPISTGGVINFINVPAKGLYMPDTIAAYKYRGDTYLVMANEGDYREDNIDRSNAKDLGAAAPLNVGNSLRVAVPPSTAAVPLTTPAALFAAGARSFSIRDTEGTLVYDSNSILDKAAHTLGIYDDGRSRDKGVEPEGVALLEMHGRTYAFIGLERTTKSAVAVFDITSPDDPSFLRLIVTDGDMAPEGLAAYAHKGKFYLAIANETVASGQTTTHTTLYRINP